MAEGRAVRGGVSGRKVYGSNWLNPEATVNLLMFFQLLLRDFKIFFKPSLALFDIHLVEHM